MDQLSQTHYHVAILPGPGMGHLIPLIEFAKRLVNDNKFHVTCIIPTIGSPTKSAKEALQGLPTAIDVVYLPPVTFDDDDDLPSPYQKAVTKPETLVFLAVTRSLSPLREVLKSLKATSNLVGLVVDDFGTDAFDIAKELDISTYIFFTSSAMMLFFSLGLPQLDERVSGEYRDMAEPVRIPGCVPIHGRDLLDPLQDRSDMAYKLMLHHAKRFALADGIILNSFVEFEEEATLALPKKPPIYPVGPLVRTGLTNPVDDGSDKYYNSLKWLDRQPGGSVLFVSFGSGGTLSYPQLNELASGLEMSEQRFLWVVRSPNDKSSNASFFSDQNGNDPSVFLPSGFVERTKTRSLVVSFWAPQAQVLAHGSTGGFLTHCGWNSILESVVHGVPLIAWPLYAEQKMNAIMLTESTKVALRPEFGENGLVGRAEIARIVKSLMESDEGKRLRDRMTYLKNAAAKALGEDGSSTKALSALASNFKRRACMS
ncbi:UDP-glucuronosyl/UDP-glucosyltransferase [Trema orientale]|uniref:Glycosyltransferase n=1 Tax=Trema orientale TaxID=63057 RepID=A0A2P5DAB3_TREOI|nr:UDP-glucuronosyl/UDP-glucosyltransferase [Trema orientale]